MNYKIPSTRSSRSTSFGFGNKILSPGKIEGPSPNSYKLPSDFDPKRKGQAFSFRCGWEAYRKVFQKEGFQNTLKCDPSFPGPGSYKEIQMFGKEGKLITLKSKLKDAPGAKKDTPGPGAYKSASTLPGTGISYSSKFKSVNSGGISSTGSRFDNSHKKLAFVPGPGQYSPKTGLSNTGNYFLSKFKSTGGSSLYKSNRKTLKVPKSDRYGPGPGSYLLPSDFGYLNLNKTVQNKRKNGARSSQGNNL